MTIQELQRTLPWERPPNDDQPLHAALHAALHIAKTAGGIVGVFKAMAHGGRVGEPQCSDLPKYCADLVICASRLAAQQDFDLQRAVIERVREKNPHAVDFGKPHLNEPQK